MKTGSSHLSESFDPTMLASLSGLSFKALYVMEGFLAGLHSSPFHGFSVEFSDYRKYQPGDDLRRLDWRLYARSDRLCTKRFMQETNVRFYVLCDTSASMEYRGASAWASKFECAKVLAAGLSGFLLKQNDAAGMITLRGPEMTPEFLRPSQKPSQFGLMLGKLDGLTTSGGPCLSNLLTHAARLIHRRSVILFFSDLLEPSQEVSLGFKQLRFLGHEVIVFQVLDADEIEFPFADTNIFEDLETGQRRVIAPSQARKKYLERFNAFMAQHDELFRHLEMPHCIVRTDRNPANALAMFLAERRRLL